MNVSTQWAVGIHLSADT